METLPIVLHTTGALVGVVLLIIIVRMPAVLALVVGALYLGLVTGQGGLGTIDTFSKGFGDVMLEVGLLIGFGVMIGAVLGETGGMARLVQLLDRRLGTRRVPYTLGGTLAVAFPAIFIDAMMVLIAPLVRGLARRPGGSMPMLGGAVVMGLELGLMLVVPGSGILALAGVLDVSLGPLFLLGVALVIPAITISLAILGFLVRRGYWRPERDEDHEAAAALDATLAGGDGTEEDAACQARLSGYPLWVLLSPLPLSLVLIAIGAVAEAQKISHPVLDFVTAPLVALFIGLLLGYALVRYLVPAARSSSALEAGLLQAGPILLLTGVGGGLAAVVTGTHLGDILGDLLGTGAGSALLPILLAWAVAAMLRTATGSPVAGAITTAGVLGPVAAGLGTPGILIALAAGAGGIFGGHVNSNFFWMCQSLLGLSTSGSLRVFTVPCCVVSVVCLPIVLLMGVIATSM